MINARINPRIIERAFTLVIPVTVVVCAIFAAKIVNDFVAARYLEDAARAAEVPARVAPAAEPEDRARSKVGIAVVERNMFCSECETHTLEPGTAVASATGGVPDTTLPIRLVATNIALDSADSFASLVNTSSGHKGAYWNGQDIPGAGPIEKIGGRYVDFMNRESGRIERVRLGGSEAAAKTKPSPTRVSARTGSSSLDAEIADKVKQVNDSTWEVDRSILTTLMSNPKALRGVRVGPAVKDGKIAGFRIARLSRRSPVAKIGIKRGDVIRAANGTELNSPDVVLTLMTQVQTLNRVAITVERGGKNVELTYLLR